MTKRSGGVLVGLTVLLLVGAVARLSLADQQGLWADEVFSVAIATGHSLEHPAELADPAFRDFVEASAPVQPEELRGYLDHDDPPASLDRVTRAVLLSDTSPPLYYWVLSLWMRVFGTGDLALRLLSAVVSLLCFPLLWSLASRLGGRPAALPTTLLFAVAPVGLYYSTEGRMYSFLWFFALALVWASVELARNGYRPVRALVWIAAGVGGFLTHYFFGFVLCACGAWLMLAPRRLRRWQVVAMAAAVGLLLLPWLRQVPESLASWRITHDWLHGYPRKRDAVLAPVRLAWGFFTTRGTWGGSWPADLALAATFLAVALGALLRGRARRLLLRTWMPLFWLAATCLGPSLFDLLRDTKAALIPRYALAGLPAGMLLVGTALGRLSPRFRGAALSAILVAWLPGWIAIFDANSRQLEDYPEIASQIGARARSEDVVLVHSVPTGVLAVARYLDADVPVADWIGQLGGREVPRDLESLIAGRQRVFFVAVHDVGEPAPEEDWLRSHACLEQEWSIDLARLAVFSPAVGDRFPVPSGH